MLLADRSIDVAALATLLAHEFGEPGARPVFVPVGGDSWNYRAGPWWISVRRDRQGHFPASYEAACTLRERGYDFILAPCRGRSGRVVFLSKGRPVVVSAFVEGSLPEELSDAERAALLRSVDRLHLATVTGPIPRETFELFFEGELSAAIATAEAAPDALGPLSRDVSELVRRNRERITGWRAELRECQLRCRADPGELVLTHGEPDPPNVMVTPSGDILLMDWGDLLWAPPERDARALVNVGIELSGRAHVKRFYELRWNLGEVAEYVARFMRPHTGDAEDFERRRQLARYLP